MGDNLKTRKFIEDLGQVINSSDLPIEVRRICVELMCEKLLSTSNEVIESELKAFKEKESENEQSL